MLWIPLVAGLAMVLAVIQSRTREDHPEYAVLLSITFSVVIIGALLPRLGSMIAVFSSLAAQAQVGSLYLAPVLKTIAIAYVTSFGSQVSKDAGEDTIATVVELAGKVVILLVALPVIQAILQALFGILG